MADENTDTLSRTQKISFNMFFLLKNDDDMFHQTHLENPNSAYGSDVASRLGVDVSRKAML